MSDWSVASVKEGAWTSTTEDMEVPSSHIEYEENDVTGRADSPAPSVSNESAAESETSIDLEGDLPISRAENIEKLRAKGWVVQTADRAAVAESGRYASEWEFEDLRNLAVVEKDQIVDLDEENTLNEEGEPKLDMRLGLVGSRVPEVEKQLYDTTLYGTKGRHLEAFEIESKFSGADAPQSDEDKKAWRVDEFAEAKLHPILLENLKLAGYDVPTPVQQWSVKPILTGRDILLTAATGSGKTAAYLIPAINKFFGKAHMYCKPRPEIEEEGSYVAEPVLLIMVPTRELAAQVFSEVRRICYRSLLRPCAVYGGGPVKGQLEYLKKGCDILIGTFGRLLDFVGKGQLSLRRVKVQVIDEADEVLREDHREELERVFLSTPNMTDNDNQLIIASATWSEAVVDTANDLLAADSWQIQLGRPGATHTNIEQRFMEVDSAAKKARLFEILLERDPERTIVFVNSKIVAQQVDDFLFRLSFPSTLLVGDMTQREREDAVRAFTIGTAPIIVCSSLAARGLDVPDVQHVINFDLPSSVHGGIDEYVNRIGRTGRIGHSGLATSFITRRDEDLIMPLVDQLNETKQKVPELLKELMAQSSELSEDGEEDEFNDNREDVGSTGNDPEPNTPEKQEPHHTAVSSRSSSPS